MVVTDSSLYELKSAMDKYPQCLVNVHTGQRVDLRSNRVITSAVQEIESQLGKEGRVLLRSSGTEPVVRIMVEGRDESQVNILAQQLAQAVASNIGCL
jgi:phosphoglucosamine mutase